MRSYLYPIFLYLIAFVLFSCNSPSESKRIEFPNLQTFDTLNVEAILKLFSSFKNVQRDTLFFTLISKLEKQNKIDLLEKYIKLYVSKYSTDDVKTIKALNKLCYFFLQSSAYDSVDKYSNIIIDLATKLNDIKQLGQAELQKGVSHFYRGNYEQSYKLFFNSIKYFEQAQDSGGLMSARTNMAQYYIRSKQPDKAIQEYLLNEKYFAQKNDSVDLSDIYMMLSDAYRMKNDIDSSDYYINKAYAIVKVLGNSYNQSICNNNIAINQIRKGNINEALLRLKENLAMIYEKKVVAEYAPTLNNIGLAYSRNNDFINAELYFKKSIQVLDSLKQLDMKLVPIGYLSSLNEEKGNYKEALYWYKQSVNLKDSLDKISNQANINELNIRFETNKKEAQLKQLRQQSEIELYIRLSLLFAMLFLIAAMAFIYNRNKLVKNTMLTSLKLKEQEVEKLALENEFNKRQLELFTQSLVDKSQLFNSIEQEIKDQSPVDSDYDSDLQLLSSQKLFTQDDWVKFKSLFEKVYPRYYARLIKSYPLLTAGEQRLFLLLKLGYESKQIAGMLAISTESIRKSKYRLKKKLNLNESDDLEQMIKNF